jgi:NAD(P)-dependent dehydrogenase (short-subunit alcohol dehydrogenase family)
MLELNGHPLLAGQVAVVTGAGQGMGKEIALGLAEAGAAVVVADINQETAAETAEIIKKSLPATRPSLSTMPAFIGAGWSARPNTCRRGGT